MQEIEIIKPDDWHVHFRDGEMLKAVVPETTRHFSRSIIMPNLIPPILTGQEARKYKNVIEKAIPKYDDFKPLMTIYLTENTSLSDLQSSYEDGSIFAAKLYPAGATTNSDSGVKNINRIMSVLEKMSEIGMPLLVHGEVTNKNVDIFDREKEFIDTYLSFIHERLPELKITLEHITTKDAVSFISEGNDNLAASITPHHLALNRNAILSGGIRPHFYCLPVLKREEHRKELVKVATSGISGFFLGTDTAPHLKTDKENSCGCAGIFNATYCLNILAQIFDDQNSIDNLENFVSLNGAKHYGLKSNNQKIKLTKKNKAITFKTHLNFNNYSVQIIIEV